MLGPPEVEFLISEYMSGGVTDYQMAAFLMAVCLRGMDLRETVLLTGEMMRSGRVMSFRDAPGPVIDKHSTGGVGDKISLVLLPAAVECGLLVPMISGRSLGFTGGTLDKLESIPGMRTELPYESVERQVYDLGGCFAGQTEEMVPADKRLYALRDSTATVESLPLIASSILSKKFSEGIEGLVVDVKFGRGAFMKGPEEAGALASLLEAVGREAGVPVRPVLSSMEEPLGRAVGNALEVAEAMDLLEGGGPAECAGLTHELVAEMLVMGGIAGGMDEGRALSREAVESGRALSRFQKIVRAQGGRLDPGRKMSGLPRAGEIGVLESPSDGFVISIDPRVAGDVVRGMGGGREKVSDGIDHSVGLVFRRKRGDRVSRGETLCEIHASDAGGLEAARRRLSAAFDIGNDPVPPVSLFPED